MVSGILPRRPFRTSVAAIAIAGAMALAGCGLNTATATSGQTVTFAYQVGNDFTWLFPIENAANAEPWDWNVTIALWLPLYAEGQGAAPVINNRLSLAYPPVWSDHDTTVTINLKHYVWSDGKPVTSRDVEMWFNLERANKTQDNSYTPGQLPDDVKSIDYPTSSSIVMHLTRSYSQQWFDENQLTWVFALPQQEWDRTSLNGPVGNYDLTTAGAKAVFAFLFKQSSELSTYATNPIWKVVDGPWRLTGFDATTYRTTLQPNKRYSGPDKPRIEKFVIESFTSNTAEVNALRSGALTFGYLTSDNYTLKSYFESHGFKVQEWAPQYVQWAELGYTSPTYGPLVRQLYIRQALQHLVNEPLYTDTAMHGLGLLTYGPVPNSPGSPYVSPEEKVDPDPYSISAARQLLTTHGWAPGPGGYMVCKHPGTGPTQCGAGIAAGRELQLSFLYSTGYPSLLAQVETYVQAAKAAGISLPLNPQSTTTMFSIGGTCPPGPCNWGIQLYSDWLWNYGQEAILPSGDTDFASGNYWAGGYSSATADQLIQEERYSTGLNHVFAFENYISRQVASVWFPTEATWSVVQDGLEGWSPQNAFGYTVPSEWRFAK